MSLLVKEELGLSTAANPTKIVKNRSDKKKKSNERDTERGGRERLSVNVTLPITTNNISINTNDNSYNQTHLDMCLCICVSPGLKGGKSWPIYQNFHRSLMMDASGKLGLKKVRLWVTLTALLTWSMCATIKLTIN